MAKVSAATMQAALNTITGHDVGSPDPLQILREDHDSATYSRWYVVGSGSLVSTPAVILGERAKWCRTTDASSTATQAAEIVTAFLDTTTTVNGNVDPNIGP